MLHLLALQYGITVFLNTVVWTNTSCPLVWCVEQSLTVFTTNSDKTTNGNADLSFFISPFCSNYELYTDGVPTQGPFSLNLGVPKKNTITCLDLK